ncbi:MAG: hypothetical protein V7K14_28810 [Nostoc sp.]|uniref:hypothetical protein n=1 Tax=Nostoc sp. TaxID=1180 RepID=UPI002FFBF9BD
MRYPKSLVGTIHLDAYSYREASYAKRVALSSSAELPVTLAVRAARCPELAVRAASRREGSRREGSRREAATLRVVQRSTRTVLPLPHYV